jgi:hypothetical protein
MFAGLSFFFYLLVGGGPETENLPACALRPWLFPWLLGVFTYGSEQTSISRGWWWAWRQSEGREHIRESIWQWDVECSVKTGGYLLAV